MIKERKLKYLKRLKKERGSAYTLLGEYTKMREKTKFRHEICGYEWYTNPDNLVGSRAIAGCPNCAYRDKSKTNEEVNDQLENLPGGPFKLAKGEMYKNQYTKIKLKHLTCGRTFKATTQTVLANHSCPYCYEENREWEGKTTEGFIQDLQKERGKEYVVVPGSEYLGANEKIKIEHTECGHIWDVRAAHILYRSGCPKCNKSKGEEFIAGVLNRNKVTYRTQVTFKGCMSQKELPFDFAIYNSDGSLYGLIEYDGIQHYKPFEHFGGEAKFRQQKINDAIKDSYCTDNGITLTRISYKRAEEEIEKIITSISQEVT